MPADKKALRAQLLAARAQTPAAEKKRIDAGVAAQVLQSGSYRAAGTVFLYVSAAGEIDTHFILRDALARGKTVCVPKCGAGGEMTARRIRSTDELSPGAHGIWEPDGAAEIVPPEAIGLLLAPALACDRDGFRLGYGGGYYDRFLCRTDALCAALCAESRLLDRLPRELHDRRCRLIFTERRVLRTDENQ